MATAAVPASPSSPPPPAPPPNKLPAKYKMFIAPAVMMLLGRLGVNYSDPFTILVVRILYASSQAVVLVTYGYIAWQIWMKADPTAMVTLKKPKKGGGFVVEEQTVKEYDLAELRTHLRTFAVSLAVTTGMHVYYTMMPALILQIVMQPISMYEHGLFAIYILGYTSLPRPFTDKTGPIMGFAPPPASAPPPTPAAPAGETEEAAADGEEAKKTGEGEDATVKLAGEQGAPEESSTLRRRLGGKSEETEG